MAKKIAIIFSTLAVLGIIIGVFFKSQKDQQLTKENESAAQAQIVRDFSYAKGNLDSKVTVVEFYDPECEACKAFHPMGNQLMSLYGDQIKFVARPMPLHGSSDMAIRLTYAAGKSGKFWEMFDLLFEKQDEWGHKQFPPLDLFMKYAQSLGLAPDQIKTLMDSPEIRDMMGLDMADAQSLGVRGTPTIFVNGKKLDSLSFQDLQIMIESELKTQNTAQ